MASQKIGDMNGKYAVMLKVALWAFWPVVSIAGWAFWNHESRISEVETGQRVQEATQESTVRQGDLLTVTGMINQNSSEIAHVDEDIDEIKELLKEIQQELRKR